MSRGVGCWVPAWVTGNRHWVDAIGFMLSLWVALVGVLGISRWVNSEKMGSMAYKIVEV